MGQQDQGRNQEVPRNTRKWGQYNSKSVGHWENNPTKEIHSITSLSQKTRKAQINSLTLHLKELEEKQQTRPKVSRRK